MCRRCKDASEDPSAVTWMKAVTDEIKAGQQIILHNLFKLPSSKFFIQASVHKKIRAGSVPPPQLPPSEKKEDVTAVDPVSTEVKAEDKGDPDKVEEAPVAGIEKAEDSDKVEAPVAVAESKKELLECLVLLERIDPNNPPKSDSYYLEQFPEIRPCSVSLERVTEQDVEEPESEEEGQTSEDEVRKLCIVVLSGILGGSG